MASATKMRGIETARTGKSATSESALFDFGRQKEMAAAEGFTAHFLCTVRVSTGLNAASEMRIRARRLIFGAEKLNPV